MEKTPADIGEIDMDCEETTEPPALTDALAEKLVDAKLAPYPVRREITCNECHAIFPVGHKKCVQCGDPIKTERELLDEAAADIEDELAEEPDRIAQIMAKLEDHGRAIAELRHEIKTLILLKDEEAENRTAQDAGEDTPEPVVEPQGETEPEGEPKALEITVADLAVRLGKIEDGVIRRLTGKLPQ